MWCKDCNVVMSIAGTTYQKKKKINTTKIYLHIRDIMNVQNVMIKFIIILVIFKKFY